MIVREDEVFGKKKRKSRCYSPPLRNNSLENLIAEISLMNDFIMVVFLVQYYFGSLKSGIIVMHNTKLVFFFIKSTFFLDSLIGIQCY